MAGRDEAGTKGKDRRGASNLLDGVEIKASIARDHVEATLTLLGLAEPDERRAVGFVEDTTTGTDLPLFRNGVILRVRRIENEDDDSTVKLRPCRRSQIGRAWLDEAGRADKLKVEEDWAGQRRVLAVSFDAELPRGRIGAVVAGQEPVHKLFDADQERFLAECAGLPINLDALTLLPLVDSLKWKNFSVPGVGDELVAERWTVGPLDFLEVSVRADDVDEAQRHQARFEQRLRHLGVVLDDSTKSKTERVLLDLVSLAATAAEPR